MDYIYGQLNNKAQVAKYDGADTDSFKTSVEIESNRLRAICSRFLIGDVVKDLRVTELKCSEQSVCANSLIVGQKVIRYFPQDPPLPEYGRRL